jgi:hypothetical protein
MARKNCTIRLTSRKLHYEYTLTTDQLEEFLNDNLDFIIANECDEPQTMLRITSAKEGIIINNSITQQCYDKLTKILNDM